MAALWRRHIDISSHLTPDELALLAEGKAGDAAERLRAHLAHCKSCFQAYQDAVEFRARALAGEEPHAPPELVKNGRKIPLRPRGKRGVTRPPRGRMILATAGGLAALAAVWIFLGPGGWSGPHSILSSKEKAVLEPFIVQALGEGLVPSQGSARKQEPVYRGSESSAEIDRIVDRLQGLAKTGKASSEDLSWLIAAELAKGNFVMARFYLDLPHAESDPRLSKLRAILADRDSR